MSLTGTSALHNTIIHDTVTPPQKKTDLVENSRKRCQQSHRSQCHLLRQTPLHPPHIQQVFPLYLHFLNALSFHTLLNGVFHLINMALVPTIYEMVMMTPFGSEC